MIGQTFLFLLAVSLVVSQEIFYTMGAGGELCGEYHHCLTAAKCIKDPKERQVMCKCPEDNPSGNGKLACCQPQNHHLFVQSDPHLKTFREDFAELPTPCPYRLARLDYEDENMQGSVELLAQNVLLKRGEYYLTTLWLGTDLRIGSHTLRQTMKIEGDIDSYMGLYNYTFMVTNLWFETSATLETELDVFNITDEFPLKDCAIEIGTIDNDNLLSVSISGLGIHLLFRPPSVKLGLDNALLPFVPGAFLMIEEEKFKKIHYTNTSYELSTWPDGPNLSEAAKMLGTTKALYVQYLMLKNTYQTMEISDQNDLCLKSSEVFLEQCHDDPARHEVLGICSSIHYDKDFLECVTKGGHRESYVSNLKEFFYLCELSVCNKDVTECKAMKQEMSERFNCPLPAVILNIDCEGLGLNDSPPNNEFK